ncbi:hypothetical protein OROMI_000054 [Orobanche minor]
MEDQIPMEVDDNNSSSPCIDNSSAESEESCWHPFFKFDSSSGSSCLDKEDKEYVKCYSDGITLARPFPSAFAKELQESWPLVESAIAKNRMECRLNLDHCYITFETCRDSACYGFMNGRDALALLSARVPVERAARVLMDGVPHDIIRTGLHRHGICTKFGIKKDEYQKRKKLLMTLPEKELAALTGCEIYFRPKNDLVAGIGPEIGLKLARRIVTDCIVRKVPPAPCIKDLLDRAQVSRRLKKLSLG